MKPKFLLALVLAMCCAAVAEEAVIYAHVGTEVLEIALARNSSAEALLELLKKGDVKVEMEDYGEFEKTGDLGATLPTNDERFTTGPGDVILYLGKKIVIYYDTNTWSFTRLGKVRGKSQKDLKRLLGSGDVTVIFSASKGKS